MKQNFSRKSRIDNYNIEELKEIVNNSYSWRELGRKLGYSNCNTSVKKTIQIRLDYYNISTEHFTSSHASIKHNLSVEDVLKENTQVADNTVRAYFLKGNYVPYECAICGLPPFWNNKELTLTLDHINGNHYDSRITNLRWVCPNCDRQLPTFGGRNSKYK